jgi:hypothetical protein
VVSWERPASNELIKFPRESLKSVQAVRIKSKQIRDVSKVPRKEVSVDCATYEDDGAAAQARESYRPR